MTEEEPMDELISPQELRAQLAGPNPPTVIDVRGDEAYRAGHIAGARHIPGDELAESLAQIPRDKPVVTY
jgi:hydroxyacylglutathione hydrolase